MKRTPLKRKTPIRSKAAKPKRRGPATCVMQRCNKRPVVKLAQGDRCASHATDLADKLVGDFVKARDGYRCQLRSFNDEPCYRPEQVYWCHLIPKDRYYATRWEPDNAVTGCAGHHSAFDHAPLERDVWCEARLGPGRWGELRQLAIRQKAVDVADVIRRFSGQPESSGSQTGSAR